MKGPKIFLKAPLAPIYINFEGGARAEKTRFFGQHFPKNAKKRFFFLTYFVKILPAAQKFWPKQDFCTALEELEKSSRSN